MILETIAAKRRERIEHRKAERPLEEVRAAALRMAQTVKRPLEKALRQEKMAFLCEVKKASPSKGVLVEDFPYLAIAREYEEAGAAAISVLTEPDWFQGEDTYLEEIARTVQIPVLRKDFTIDPYQIYEAKCLGASAILLIVALLELPQLRDFLQMATELGLSAIVETHTEAEVATALEAGATIIGVNNRNLKTFEVDLETSFRLRKQVPQDRIFVSESGIRTAEDVARLREIGTDAVLIGETLMRSADKKRMLTELAGY